MTRITWVVLTGKEDRRFGNVDIHASVYNTELVLQQQGDQNRPFSLTELKKLYVKNF